jgi:hypothetical protein
MRKIITLCAVLSVLINCAPIYRPTIPLTVNVPPDLISAAVTAALHPAKCDTVLLDSVLIFQMDSLKAEVASKAEKQKVKDGFVQASWVVLGGTILGLILFR